MDANTSTEDLGRALEAALPKLVEKLRELKGDLSPEEFVVFAEIIHAAAEHTSGVEADSEHWHAAAEADTGTEVMDLVELLKPRSVHVNLGMKKQFQDLPKMLQV